MVLIAKVAVDQAAFYFDTPFDYLVPAHLHQQILPLMRVSVPFGRGNNRRFGVVMQTVWQQECATKLKEIDSVLDDKLCHNPEWEKLILFLKDTTFCTYYDAVRTILPSALSAKISEYFRLGDLNQAPDNLTQMQQNMLSLLTQKKGVCPVSTLTKALKIKKTDPNLVQLLQSGAVLLTSENKKNYQRETTLYAKLTKTPAKVTPKGQLVLDFLQDKPQGVPLKLIMYHTGVSRAVIATLQKNSCIDVFEQFDYKMSTQHCQQKDINTLVLTDQQQPIFEQISRQIKANQYQSNLIFGVTGSGKTAIFLKLIDSALKSGKTAMMLVPEIALTPQMIRQFTSLFGRQVALMHSALSNGEKNTEYKRIVDGEAKIVVGTRSAVFAPLKNIGLIILDEEQESSYHSDSAPKYHAADVAKFRANYHGAQVVFASATPQITTYYQAANGKMNLFTLTDRYGESKLPKVDIADMKEEIAKGNPLEICTQLAQEIKANLTDHKQSILLINRRGYNTSFVCSNCGAVAKCEHCDIPLTYHAANHRLVCHYCGRSKPAITICDNCGGNHVQPYGAGTQKIEQQVGTLFPQARILRMDTDTTAGKQAYQQNFDRFGKGEYDILVGTQMVAKGLDFENVTLVGVLGIDNTLNGSSFKSFERTFSLVTQVVGRGGRGKCEGRAIIQSMEPDASVLEFAAKQDYVAFYNEEIAARKAMLYPPFCDLCLISFTSSNREKCLQTALTFAKAVQTYVINAPQKLPIRLMGPTPFGVEKVNDKYRYKIICKCKNNQHFRQMISSVIYELHSQKLFSGASVGVDMYPDSEI